MSRPYLLADFAKQSLVAGAFDATIVSIDAGRGLAISLATSGRGSVDATVRVAGLLAKRFYRVDGARDRFVRTDEHGTATIALTVTHGAILALWPVV